jgi:hypothetical protein
MAASEAGGSTCHHLWNIPVDTKNYQLDNQRIEVVRKKMNWVMALIIDERSMLSSANLAIAEAHTRNSAYRGQKQNKMWGGVPIVILVGDDYQLPSVETGCLSTNTDSKLVRKSAFFTLQIIIFPIWKFYPKLFLLWQSILVSN